MHRKTLALLLCLAPLLALGSQLDEPFLQKTDLWKAQEGGHKLYRIPGIVVTRTGTVLAYAEARRNTGGDWDTIDLVMRRSVDGGKTFSEPRVVVQTGNVPRNPVAIERKQGQPEDVTYNNPIAIADKNGSVHFLFCREYMRAFYSRSDDDGKTFSSPVDITHVFDDYRRDYAWRVIALGPGHGIQLRHGRLLVPVWLSLGQGGNGHHPSVTSTIYSDDHGRTWRRGDIAVPDTSETPNPNEATAVELASGSVLLNVRTGSDRNRRLVVISKDGAHGWSTPVFQEDLPDPLCFGSLARFSKKKRRDKSPILFSNPDNLSRQDGKTTPSKDRRNLTIAISYNDGKSWETKKVLEPGPSAYSDLAVSRDGTILCFYEAGDTSPYRKLVLARFNLPWLTSGAGSQPRNSALTSGRSPR